MTRLTLPVVRLGLLITYIFLGHCNSYKPAPNEICLHEICEYDFTISRAQTMTYAENGNVYDVALNGSDLVVVGNLYKLNSEEPFKDVIGKVVNKSDVITADGFLRDVILINGQFPGPTLEIMEGAKVIIHVYNKLIEVTSIHWHGLYQTGTNYMDGVPYLTQCPILPNQFFRYDFKADPSGTHWYHSHYSTQRFDGLYGMLVVHKNGSSPEPSYSVLVSDWYHAEYNTLEIGILGSGTYRINPKLRQRSIDNIQLAAIQYISTLIGGRGRWLNQSFPLQEYNLEHGVKKRFRMVHSGAEFSFEISADNHQLELVACDGREIQPIVVDSIIILPGESVDFNIYPNRTAGSYWMRAEKIARGVWSDEGRAGGLAILNYQNGTQTKEDPTTVPRVCNASNPCRVFNCPYGHYPRDYYKVCIAIDQLHSNENQSWIDETYGTGKNAPDIEVFLNFATFNRGLTVNAIRFQFPRSILLQNQNDTAYYQPCDEEVCAGPNGCSCTHIQSLPFNQTVDLILTNYEDDVSDDNLFPFHHSIHLHGHSFAVLGVGFAPQNDTGHRNGNNPDAACTTTTCNKVDWTYVRPSFNTSKPVLKDAVVVPAEGYTVIRFRTNNPGLWFMHCHLDLHTMLGMGVIIDEAHDQHPQLPPNFPTCGDFNATTTLSPPTHAPGPSTPSKSASSVHQVLAVVVGIFVITSLSAAE